MKKRLMCLCLCLVTMFSLVLTACSTKTDEELVKEMIREQSKGAYTLTMWVVSEEKVDDETGAEITAAINDLMQTKHNTKLVIKYFTADEYYAELDKTLAAYSATASGKVPEIGDFEIPENGLYEAIYPEVMENQVDIIYIGDLVNSDGSMLMSGEEMYRDLRAKGHLAAIGSYLDDSDVKKINEFVSPTLLNAVKEGEETYALPNNNTLGSYTYMLLNKELMDRYSMQGKFLAGEMTGFYTASVYQYLNMVLADSNNDGVVLPVDASYEECLSMLAYYWNVDPDSFDVNADQFSVFGTLYGAAKSVSLGNTVLQAESLLANPQFVSAYLQLNKFRLEQNDFFRNDNNAGVAYADTAIKFYEGDLDELTIVDGVSYYYEGDECYYAVPVKYPTVGPEDIYDDMFAVCAYAPKEYIERSMAILAYLNTDVEIRNLFQYGVEEEHYYIMDDEIVRTEKGEGYRMDLFVTGNPFIAYPEAWISDTAWENGKEQNRDALINPMLGFDLPDYAQQGTTASDAFKSPVTNKHTLTYVTGLNKEVLEDDLLLNAWLSACDDRADGVYMYKNVEKVDKTTYATLYVYNTLGESDMIIETNILRDPAGTEVGLDINLSYKTIFTTDTSVLGYELSVISYTYPTSHKGSITCDVDGKKTAIVTQTRGRALKTDLLNTDTYEMDVYANLTMAHFYENAEIYAQLTEWKNEPGNVPVNYVLTWQEQGADGKNYYHYVIYRKNLSYATSVDVHPVGSLNAPALKVLYTAYEGTAPEGDYKDYSLCYVYVKADAGVSMGTPTFMENHVVDQAKTETVVAENAIDFNMLGAMDTDLVKYAAALNSEIVALLDACTSYEEFEALVNDLVALFTADAESLPTLESTALNEVLSSGVVGGDFATLYANIAHMTSVGTMQNPETPENDVIEELGENRIYYYSPAGIYYKWLEVSGYLPKEK